jgi:simple sugar transport system permease protein
MSDFFTASVLVATFAAGVRLAMPFLLAALGETLGQRSGVLNLGVDGVMLLGAFFAYWTVLETDSRIGGVIAGLVVGMVMGVVYAVVTLVFQAEQGISGIGIFLFGLGMSELLFLELVGTPLPISAFDDVPIPGLSSIPWLGDMFFNHSPLVYVAIVLVFVLTWLINKTTFGLNVRAVGENPHAADSLGVGVLRTRAATIIAGNTLAGVAGAALTIELGTFQNNLTNGIGFIAVALVYFGAWRPFGVLAGSLLYGLVTATVTQLKVLDIVSGATASLATTAPAVLTVLALAFIARRSADVPASLTVPFSRSG